MRVFILGILICIGLLACQKEDPIVVSTTIEPRVLINGQPLAFSKTNGEQNGNLVMVPAQEIMEALGYTCTWNIYDHSLVCIKNSESIVFTLGEIQAIVNQNAIYQLASPIYRNSTLLIEAHFLKNLSSLLVEWNEQNHSLQIYDYDELHGGLYFYDTKPNRIDDWNNIACQKLIVGEENPYFDPNKPTIIWVHGWQSGAVADKYRPSFHLYKDGTDKFSHQKWKEEGWNVAIFHWEQFADETLPYDAESKINSASNNSVDMRWKKSDGNFATAFDSTVTIPIAEVFAETYAALAERQTNTTIRLAGSSFGGQVALHGTERMVDNNIQPLPSRVALLDMAWTSNYVNNQSLYTTGITERAITKISPLLPVEYYRTSLLTTFFTPDALIEQAAFQEMVFDYAGTWGIELKHTVITHHYLWSLEYAAPVAYGVNQQTVGVGLSATTDDATVRQMMGMQYHWQHTVGTSTINPNDDVFERQLGAGY